MLTSFEDKDIFKIPHGERPIFHGAIPEFEGCNSSQDFWKIKIVDGNILAEWDGTQKITLPDGTVIDTGQGDLFWASKTRKSLAGLFSNGAHTDKNNEFKEMFRANGVDWDSEEEAWLYVEGDKQGQKVGANDGFTIDITSNFGSSLTSQENYSSGGLMQQAALYNWINNGAEGFDHLELTNASTDVFWTLSKGKIESEMADLVVLGSNGSINFNSTELAFDNYIGSLNSSLASDRKKSGLLDFFTFGLAKSEEKHADEYQYRERYNSLIGAYSDFVTDDIKLIDGTQEINQFFGPVALEDQTNGYIYHPGLDIDLVLNEKMYPGFSGNVTYSNINNGTTGYGNTLLIEHGFQWEGQFNSANFFSRHAHMNSLEVSEGDFVKADDVIGYGGKTGNSTGEHNHYQIQASTYFGENSFLVDGLNIDMSNLGYNNTATNTNKYDPHDLYRYWFKNYTD